MLIMLILILYVLAHLTQCQCALALRAPKVSESKLHFGSVWSAKFCHWDSKKITLPVKYDSKSRNLIIGIATGPSYTFDKLAPFCKSARLSGFSGNIVIGVSKLRRNEERKRMQFYFIRHKSHSPAPLSPPFSFFL